MGRKESNQTNKKTLIKLTHYDETKIKGHDSQIVRAKENLKFSHCGQSYR